MQISKSCIQLLAVPMSIVGMLASAGSNRRACGAIGTQKYKSIHGFAA
jgi:hypothetical protein